MAFPFADVFSFVRRDFHGLTDFRPLRITAASRPIGGVFDADGRAGAGWQSGYAEDCKSSDVGSIPASASTTRRKREVMTEYKKFLSKAFRHW